MGTLSFKGWVGVAEDLAAGEDATSIPARCSESGEVSISDKWDLLMGGARGVPYRKCRFWRVVALSSIELIASFHPS